MAAYDCQNFPFMQDAARSDFGQQPCFSNTIDILLAILCLVNQRYDQDAVRHVFHYVSAVLVQS
ncbi:hypothetical protein M405DRAFT_821749 [Rhizopogon salebrosus TDB-379]|nr:hypothetical protein M405DRAFT_821749 [Rhizopogon salebrosus TDB-379]